MYAVMYNTVANFLLIDISNKVHEIVPILVIDSQLICITINTYYVVYVFSIRCYRFFVCFRCTAQRLCCIVCKTDSDVGLRPRVIYDMILY